MILNQYLNYTQIKIVFLSHYSKLYYVFFYFKLSFLTLSLESFMQNVFFAFSPEAIFLLHLQLSSINQRHPRITKAMQNSATSLEYYNPHLNRLLFFFSLHWALFLKLVATLYDNRFLLMPLLQQLLSHPFVFFLFFAFFHFPTNAHLLLGWMNCNSLETQ